MGTVPKRGRTSGDRHQRAPARPSQSAVIRHTQHARQRSAAASREPGIRVEIRVSVLVTVACVLELACLSHSL
eukprot:6891618-Alexandrium_andersonii.AAC.1